MREPAGTARERRPRILFVINSLAGGGAERVFTSLLAASSQRQSEYRLAVALLDDDPPGYTLPGWLPVFQLDCGHHQLASIRRLAALVASWQPDLTVSFLTRANVASALAMARRRRPCILSERTDTKAQLDRTRVPLLSHAIVRLAYGRATRVIAVSHGVAESLAANYSVPGRRIEVINNPVDAAAIRRAAEDPPACPVGRADVVAMGRLCAPKNFSLAIRAFARSRWSGRLIILGDGPLAAELRRLGSELGLGDRLVFAGFQRNPYAVIARAGLFILTSNQEGFSNSLVEAMALGIPVISTDCRFSPAEILDVAEAPRRGEVVSGRGGLLIPTGDEDALVRALDELTADQMRARFASEARQRADEFDSSRTFERYWQVIEDVLPASAQRPLTDVGCRGMG